MNTKKQFGLKTFLTLSLFALISCSNLIQQNNDSSQQDKPSADGNTYLVIKSATLKQTSRSAQNNFGPGLADAKLENLVDLKIFSISDSGTEKKIVEAETYEKLIEKTIPVEPGNWKFKLTAELMGVPFSGTTPVEIKAGVENSVSFTLTSDVLSGKLSFTVSWAKAEENSNANKIKVVLKKAVSPLSQDNEPAIVTKVIEAEDITNKSASVKIDKLDNGNELSGGTYYLQLKFYNEGTEAALNTTEYYVNIINGLTTYADLEVNLKETFKITYEANDGELVSGAVQPLNCFSQLSEDITLPAMTKPGYFWGGWYDNEDFTGEAITKIPASSDKNWTVYAKWNEPVLYVSGTGDDTNDGFSADTPLKTIDTACEKIIELGEPDYEWVIKIIGEVKGVPKGTSDTDATYGPNTIPEDVNGHAKSILLTGNTPVETEFAEPSDCLNRGYEEKEYRGSTGTVLTIDTSVPVTITNLKISGGVGTPTKGAGIHISSGATVMLGDGMLLIHNKAGSNSHGGAIQNEGTLFIYGTAVIGDKTIEEYAYDSSTDYNFATTSNRGGGAGGVYNGKPNDNTVSAKLYLGYKGFDSDGITPVKDELKGGFYHNGGSAGALYNCENCFVYFDSGTMAWNETCASGGAICNAAGGTIEMTGGNILNNQSYEKGNYTSYGGGVANYGSTSVFIMSGGTINKNVSENNTGYGGGVYNKGKFYMYGTAVIGDKDAKTCATSTAFGNKASQGGGIYNAETGALYIGYKPDNNGEPVEETLSGGIYYNYSFYPTITDTNYSQNGGGAIESTGTIKIASGTIAYNATEGYGGAIRYVAGKNENVFEIIGGTITNNIAKGSGGAIYLGQKNAGNANVLYLGGNPVIPVENSVEGFENYLNDIYIRGLGTTIQFIFSLTTTSPIRLTFYEYNTTINPLKIKAGSSGVTLADEYTKFSITDENLNGRTKIWRTTAEGKLEPVATSYYVSENGNADNDGLTKDTAFAAVSSAFTKIWTNYTTDNENANQDYIIYISGNVKDHVNIEDMMTVKYANSITLQGLNGLDSTTNLPKDTLDGNYSDGQSGSTVSISSIIPVAIKSLNITGSKMLDNTSLSAGVYINPDSIVSIEDGTVISGNDRGIYAAQTTLIIDGAIIKNNTGKGNGTGLSAIASNVKMLSGSISGNTLNTDFLNTNSISEISGVGIYLSNGSTFEMTGGTITENQFNTNTAGLTIKGKGLYVSSDSTFNMGGKALITLDNDIYLQSNVKVNVISELMDGSSRRGSTNPAAMLTPENYPTCDSEGNITENVELLNIANNLYMYNVAKQFRISPQVITNGLQYWSIGSNSTDTETYGKFVKVTGTGFTVSYTTGISSDIQVIVSNPDGGNVEQNASYVGGGTIIFTAPSTGYSSYKWKLDNVVQTTPQENVLQVDTSTWDAGIYDITLEARSNTGSRCSYTAQIQVSRN